MTKARDLANAGTALGAVTATELGYVDGVTSAIQTQIDAKAASSTAVTLTGTQTLTNKTLTNPVIASVVNNTLTSTTGDMIYASAANTPARLGIGSTGNVLTVAGGVPTWATAASGGGMTLISETVASAVTSLSLSSIPSTYKQLVLIYQGITHSNNSSQFGIRFNNDSTNYYGIQQFGNSGNSFGNFMGVDSKISAAFGNCANSTNQYDRVFGYLVLDNYSSTTKYKTYYGNFGYYNNNSLAPFQWVYQGNIELTSAIDSINIVRASGTGTFSNTTNTSIRLYGVA